MRKIIVAGLFILLSSSAFAWTIGPMNYQGRLLDNAGIPVTGSYNFKVRIYDALTGGVLKFSEQQNSIVVNDGVYSFLVSTGTGSTGSWDINLWNTPSLYLEIEVNGQTLTPRHLLAAAPFAFQANLALTTNNALALGGISASQFQNNLADICTAGKGKWLELAQKCLGIGASFPGPTLVNLNTLTASTDLSGLDLSKADISGINFGTANFTGSIFKGTKINAPAIQNANMTDALWDGLVIAGVKTFNNNFTGATISNIDFTGGNLSGAILQGASIADLNGCPASLPAGGYQCRQQVYASGKYMVVGPNMNYSETSLMKNRLNGASTDAILFDAVNISGSTFKGNKIDQWQVGSANLSNTNFEQTTIRNVYTSLCDFSSAVFSESSLFNVNFSEIQSANNFSFNSSELKGVFFSTGSAPAVLSFGGSSLSDVEFNRSWDGVSGSTFNLDFESSSLNNVRIYSRTTSVYIFNTTIAGGIYLGDMVEGVSMENAHFVNGNIGGNWRNLVDNSSTYINVSFFGADLTGATGLIDSPPWMVNVNWYGAICPDGYHVTTQGGTCVGHFL